MAEETENFSPLDPLGPAYGKINRPTLDVQGLSPFEGDRITQEPINFPRPQFHPVMPGMNITKPQQAVRQNVVGRPGKEPNQNGTASDQDIKMAHADYIKGALQTNRPKDQFAKIYSYDAGPDGNAFYKRYMAYGKETFDRIGFSPLRDNEAVFNSRTTMADDWSRMMTHSFWPLFTTGMASGPKSMIKMLSGDLTSADLQEAREYEEAAAIGQSSKGGLMGFMNNTVMNFGYTAGIISEAILEEAAGMLLAPVTAGGSMWLTTMNNLRKIKGVGAAVDGMSAVRSGLRSMADITGARRAWNAVHDLGTTTKVGRFLNPFENTFDAARAIKADNLTGLAKLSKTAGGLYRDARSINMAVSEARLEAGMVENTVYDQLYKEHFNKTGEAPDNETQKEMIKKAKDASLDTFYKNAALIYASNKITFHNVVSPRGGIRNFIKSTVDDVATVGGGKFGNVGKIVYDNAKKSFAFEANNIKNLAKSWWKNPGFKSAAKTIGYFKANFTEGFQENAQEIIAGANEKYYIDSFNSQARQAHEYSMSTANYSMKSQGDYYLEEARKQNPLTAQGFETFASGFFMGMFAHPLNNAIPFLSVGYNRMFDKEAYEQYKTKKTEITEKLVGQLNEVKIDDFLKSKLFDYGAQDIIGRIKQGGDKKEALDAENESLIMTMLGSGVAETFAEKVRSMNDLDDNEFMDAMNIEKDDIPKYRERVQYAADKMERIRKTHQYYQDKYPNPVNLDAIKDMDQDSEDYEDLIALHHGWDMSVKNAVFFNETFEDTRERMKGVENKFLRSVNRDKTAARELGLLLTPSKLQQELQLLVNEADSLDSLPKKDAATKKELARKRGLAKNIESYLTALEEFDGFFNRDQMYDLTKAEVSKKLGREATKEEVEKYIDKNIGKLSDEKKQTKVLSNLKQAFSDYAKFVSEANDDFAFDDNLEKAYTLLTDHYKLGTEARQMAKYIDRLNNPSVIFEVAERNKAWMKNLYNRRKSYYTKMVRAQMKAVEDNTLLNVLADKGIFVALDEFETWQKTGAIPSQFFDNANKRVIIPGSDEYTFLAMYFQQASGLNQEEVSAEETLDEPVELITPTSIQEVEAALKNLEAKQLVAKGNEYENIDDPNDKYARVSTRKGEFEGSNQRAANRGTIIDDMLRGFINGTATKIEDIRKIYIEHPLKDQTQPFNAEFIRELFAIFNEVKDIADNRGITLTAKVPTLWGTIDGKKYAGTIDLLGIDKSGQVFIIDLKTSSQERRSHYEMVQFLRDNAGDMFNSIMEKIKAEEKNNILNVKNFTAKEQKVIDQLVEQFKDKVNKNLNRLALYDYSGQDSSQQSGYAELLRQRTGITAKKITIFPIRVTVEDKVYTKAEAEKNADGKFTMDVEIDRATFPETPKVKPKAKVEDDWNSIIDNAVSERELDSIIDQMDKAGVMTPDFLMTINKKRESIKTEAPAAESTEAESVSEKAPVVEKAKPTVEGKVLGQKPTSPKISEVVGKTVYYNGKPYMVQKEGVRYILNSETTIIELAGDKNSTLESLGIDYFKGEFYKPEYDITVNSENSVTVNGVSYIVKSDAKGNVIGLSPLNKPEQVIKNEKLLIAVEIERNKTTFVNTNAVLDEVDTEEILDQIEETDPATHQKLMNVERVYNMNWNETVEAGLSNLYSKKPLTESQRLAVDLWVTDAIINMTSVYNRTSDPIYANALDNLEIINTLLYEGYTEKPKKAGTDESTKRTVKQTSTEAERKPGKTVSEEPTVILDSKALNKLGFTDLMLENMTEQELVEASRFTTPEEASEFREAIIDKQRALDIYHPYITEFTLYKDAQLVANQTLLRKDETGEYVIFADTDDIVVVKSFDKKTGDVTLQKLGSNVTLVADISELDPVLIFKEQVMTEPEKAEETITNKKEAATFTEEGNTLLTNFLDSKTRQSEIEKGVESPEVTNDDLDDNLLNDLKC